MVLVADPDVRGAVVGTALAFLGLDHREEIWAAGIQGLALVASCAVVRGEPTAFVRGS